MGETTYTDAADPRVFLVVEGWDGEDPSPRRRQLLSEGWTLRSEWYRPGTRRRGLTAVLWFVRGTNG